MRIDVRAAVFAAIAAVVLGLAAIGSLATARSVDRSDETVASDAVVLAPTGSIR